MAAVACESSARDPEVARVVGAWTNGDLVALSRTTAEHLAVDKHLDCPNSRCVPGRVRHVLVAASPAAGRDGSTGDGDFGWRVVADGDDDVLHVDVAQGGVAGATVEVSAGHLGEELVAVRPEVDSVVVAPGGPRAAAPDPAR